MINYGKQDINQDDINNVIEVLKSDWLTQGPNVSKFESVVGNYVGAKYAIAVNSATSALHIAYLSLGLGKGDILWTVPNTFVATANMALLCGAMVDFVDINITDFNLDIDKLEQKLIIARQKDRLPKIVTAVHFAGLSCNMQKLRQLADEYGFHIVEDASHAIGAKYNDYYIGGCQYSDIAIFSFHPVKIITTGEGGMVLTNNSEMANKCIKLRSHGVTRDAKEFELANDGRWKFEQVMLGYNYRMPDINAILGYSQMERINSFIERRNWIACQYKDTFSKIGLKYQEYGQQSMLHAYHLFTILLNNTQERYDIDKYLLNRGYSSQVHYYPVYLQPYYRKLGYKESLCPVSEDYYSRCLSIPIYPAIEDQNIAMIIKHISEFINKNR